MVLAKTFHFFFSCYDRGASHFLFFSELPRFKSLRHVLLNPNKLVWENNKAAATVCSGVPSVEG